ncbi:MAG: NACHT domain-containing protein, partial [Candidatus Methylumidiphilus sp.]
MLHHPWDYLAESDSHESRALIHQKCDLVLRGHLHKTQTERVNPPDPSRTCLELAAGCVYENSQYPNAFQWVELYSDPRKIRVKFRKWIEGAWAIDRNQPGCPEGATEYDLSASTQSNKIANRQAKKTNATPKTKSIAEVSGLARYREAAESLHASIPLAGFKLNLRVTIDLTDLYVPLHAMVDLRSTGDCGFADAQDAMTKLVGHGSMEIPLIRAFTEAKQRKRRGLVILGDPGSGKTTHLKRLLLACLREGPQTLGLETNTVPVFLPLRMLDDLNADIDAFIEKTLDSPFLDMPKGFGKRLLKRGHLLLMFDGLDEVSDPKQRAQVSRWIEEAARTRPTCTAVVTCRFAGYDDQARLGSDFLELHLRPLTPEQAEIFIRNWYRAVETGLAIDPAQGAIVADERSIGLVQRLLEPDFRSARMAEMTRNPLLLANLCLVHRDRGTLPRNRHKLYDDCIEVLLELWRNEKKLPISVSAEIGRRTLQPIALWLHGQEQRTRATAAELDPVIAPVLQSLRWQGGDAVGFLRAVRDESGLLTGWGPDQYGFMHLGFQEYLASLEIRRLAFEGDKDAVLEELACHYGQSWWQEVILLLIA